MSFDVDRQNASLVKCYRGVVADRSHTGGAPLIRLPGHGGNNCARFRWISLPVRRSQYYAHRALPACLCHLCSPHRRDCGFCPSAAEGRAAGGDVEGFPIRRRVTRARGRCKRCGSSLITRAHWGAPRERLWICKQDVFKDKPARRRLEICAIQ
jgi:hypothetical protein